MTQKWAEMKGDVVKGPQHPKIIAQGLKNKKLQREIKAYKSAKESGVTLINPNKRRRDEEYEKEKEKSRRDVFGGELKINAVGRFTKDGQLKVRSRDVSRINTRGSKGPSSGPKLNKMFK